MELDKIIELSQDLYSKKNFISYNKIIDEEFKHITLNYIGYNLIITVIFYKDCVNLILKTMTFDGELMTLSYKITYSSFLMTIMQPIDIILLKLDLLQEKIYKEREEYEKFNRKEV